jgi:hypothetical protein
MPGIPLGYSEIEIIKSNAKPHRTPKALGAKSLCCVSTEGIFKRAEKWRPSRTPSLRLRFGNYQDKHHPHALVRFHQSLDAGLARAPTVRSRGAGK